MVDHVRCEGVGGVLGQLGVFGCAEDGVEIEVDGGQRSDVVVDGNREAGDVASVEYLLTVIDLPGLVGPRTGDERAGLEPPHSVGRETRSDHGVVAVELCRCQHVAPAAVRSLVEERVRAVLEHYVDSSAARLLAHFRESTSRDRGGPEVFGNFNVEKGGELSHLTVEVGFQIVVVHEVRRNPRGAAATTRQGV